MNKENIQNSLLGQMNCPARPLFCLQPWPHFAAFSPPTPQCSKLGDWWWQRGHPLLLLSFTCWPVVHECI